MTGKHGRVGMASAAAARTEKHVISLSQRAFSTELARVAAREACVGHAQGEQVSFHHARRPAADSAEAIAEPRGSKQSVTMSRDKLTSAVGPVQWKRAMEALPARNFAHNV